jgi:soluble lytic murein transglycosylase-like protein
VIQDAAARQGLDPRLLASLVWVESSFDAAAASPKGAVGLAQVMPTTAADLGIDPHNPVQNVEGGARYLKHNLQRFGRTDLALAAYNAGPATVAQVGGIPPIPETRQYVDRVLQTYRRLGG